ncbi:MAG: GDSL-type esterase/lipase family protein, partial [Polaribacter sp.]
LLERGFHIAYCNVANLHGNKEAMKRWDAFYKILTLEGFSKKVVLEGMSSSGLPIYNWAVRNPNNVACIYADTPALDGKSWQGNSKGSKPQWKEFKNVYGLKTDTQVTNFNNHPHSFKNPTRIVQFILSATNQKLNLAKVPASSGEYRSGAGWSKGTDWWTQAFDIDLICKNSGKADILFVGNSITQGWGGGRPHVLYTPGKKALDTYFKGMKVIGAGISGDRTQQVLWRLKNGTYQACNPDYIVLTIGVNNFLNNDSAAEISEGIKEIVNRMQQKFSKTTHILLFGPLPTGIKPTTNRRKKYQAIHKSIKSLAKASNITYCNPIAYMTDQKGFLNLNLYKGDGIHLKVKGYMVWGRYIKETIQKIEK